MNSWGNIHCIYLYKIHLGAPIVWDKWIVGGYTVVVGPPAPALSSVQSLNGRQMIKISSHHCQYFTEIDFANCPRNWHFFPETVSIFCTNCFSFNNWSRMQRDQRHFISYFRGTTQNSSLEKVFISFHISKNTEAGGAAVWVQHTFCKCTVSFISSHCGELNSTTIVLFHKTNFNEKDQSRVKQV